MKTASPQLEEKLKKASHVKALPKILFDWNLNRYHDTRVENTPVEENAGYDVELFPIESIVEPLRPYKGINKARVGHSTVSREYFDVGGGKDARFYIADDEDLYKYWTSPKPAVSGVIPVFSIENFPNDIVTDLTGHDSLTSARPKVEYGTWSERPPEVEDDDEDWEPTFTAGTVFANKIVIKLENSWATPDDFDIVIARDDGNVVVTDEELTPGWEGLGEIVLRWNGTSWTHSDELHTVDGYPDTDEIKSIQLVVRTMREGYNKTLPGEPLEITKYYDPVANVYLETTGDDSFLDVIEIAAHLEADLTDWLVDTSDTFDLGEESMLYPLGTVTTNSATVTLSNLYENSEGEWVLGAFNSGNDDELLPWRHYIDANAYVTMDYTFYDENNEEIDTVRQFSMFTDVWGGQSDESVSLDLSDYSKFFNEQVPLSAMWENLKVPEIMWRLLDSVGFSDYQIDRDVDRVTEHKVPVFWTDGELTVWAVLDQLAKASQSAIYFDAYGVLNIKTRDFAFSAEDAPVWTFQSYDDTEQLSNIVFLEKGNDFEPNRIKVVWQKTNWSEYNRGQPTMQKVWEPEDESVVLRGTPLVKPLDLDDEFLWIGTDDVKVWPYEGMVNIEGEIIKYKGKQFKYFTGETGEIAHTTVVKSEDEKDDVQREKADDGYLHKSLFTGALKIKKRGVWNSDPRAHTIEPEGYSVRQLINGTRTSDVAGMYHIADDSQVEMRPGSRHKDYKDQLFATKGGVNDSPWYFWGTKMMFVKKDGRSTQTAGLVLYNNGANEDGYFIEFTTTARLGGKERKKRDELIVYSRVNGDTHRIGKQKLAIAAGVSFEVDVTVKVEEDGDHRLGVWVNGKNVFDEDIKGAKRNTPNGKFGMFTRGKTLARYEFLYALKQPQKELPNDFSYFDKVRRGFYGSQWDREWVYEWQTRVKRHKKKRSTIRYRYNQHFFDEFGAYVHEIREYNVSFDPVPVLHSRLYYTNDWSCVAIQYRGTPFGAKFIIANTTRANAVVHGEDKLSFAGTDSSVDQVLTVLGRPLVVADAEEIIAENTDQIRARGKIESELADNWIQTEAMAKSIAQWIRDNFTYSNETVSLSVFGNPLIEPSDVVRVEYPEKNISADYFVTAVRTDFEAGITTNLELRRRV